MQHFFKFIFVHDIVHEKIRTSKLQIKGWKSQPKNEHIKIGRYKRYRGVYIVHLKHGLAYREQLPGEQDIDMMYILPMCCANCQEDKRWWKTLNSFSFIYMVEHENMHSRACLQWWIELG